MPKVLQFQRQFLFHQWSLSKRQHHVCPFRITQNFQLMNLEFGKLASFIQIWFTHLTIQSNLSWWKFSTTVFTSVKFALHHESITHVTDLSIDNFGFRVVFQIFLVQYQFQIVLFSSCLITHNRKLVYLQTLWFVVCLIINRWCMIRMPIH